MCLSPIRVPNPSRRFADGLSRQFLYVPCGHCAECKKQAEDDWFVRAFFEYKHCKANGGDVWFILLTYKDDDMPWYVDDETGFTCPSFNPDHFKKFRDKFRTYLLRDKKKGIIDIPDPSGDNQVKFKFCLEYGGQLGRPHCHLQIFVPFEIKIKDHSKYHSDVHYMRGIWNGVTHTYDDGLIRRCWPHGFVSWSKKHGCKIKSENGIQYAQKYVFKEQKWLKKYGITDFIRYLKNKIKEPVCSDDVSIFRSKSEIIDLAMEKKMYYEEKLREFKRVIARHFTSTNFGVDAVKCFQTPDGFDISTLADDKIDLTKYGKTPNPKHPSWTYHIPRYIKRKIMYTQDSEKLWMRNDIGMQVAAFRFWRSMKFQEELYSKYFKLSDMLQHTSFLCFEGAKTLDEVKRDYERIRTIMDGRTVNDLVVYDKVYRGIPLAYDCSNGVLVPYHEREHLEGLNYDIRLETIESNRWIIKCIDLNRDQMMKVFHDNERSFYLEQLANDRYPDPKKCARCKRPGFFLDRTGFEVFDCFKGFDDVLGIIETYESLIGEAKQRAYDTKDERKKKILSICCPEQEIWLTT